MPLQNAQRLPSHLLPLRETGLRLPCLPVLRSHRRSSQIVLTRPSNCYSAGGGLAFLGTTAHGQTIWLSQTGAGTFALTGSGQDQLLDQWTQDHAGTQVSFGPPASNSNSGTVSLLHTGSSPCVIATRNQQDAHALSRDLLRDNLLSALPPGVKEHLEPRLRQKLGSSVTPASNSNSGNGNGN